MVRPIPCTWVDFQKLLRFNIMQDKDCRSLGHLVASFLPCIVQFDLMISDQLRYSLNIYQFDCSVLCFLIENSSNKRIKSTSCFIFLFEISKKKIFEKGYGRKIGFLGSEIFLVWSSVFRIESMRRRWDTLGIMGLHGISGQDYWTEESYWRPTLQGKPGELAGI